MCARHSDRRDGSRELGSAAYAAMHTPREALAVAVASRRSLCAAWVRSRIQYMCFMHAIQ
eukprot:2117804-Pleurochrysis_carterae.AAC.1